MHLYIQIRKYLLWIALLGAIFFGGHILVLYWYNDAVAYPEVGGTLHIGLIGENASIDLLSYDPRSSGNETNDMLVNFLYRGMLSYDLENRKITEDLGNCGIDQFPTFRCTLNANALWHDGTPIEIDDVIATYDFYKTSSKNPGFQSRLDKLSVYEDSGEVVFSFDTTDITTLNLLFLPILDKDDIGQFEEQYNFAQNSFSGPYVFQDRSFDEQMGVTQILLQRNPIYGDLKDTYIQNIVISFFPDADSLAKFQDRLHISLFDDHVVKAQGDTHETYVYQRPQYFAAFLHSANLPLSIRKALATDILPQISIGDESQFRPMNSIFFDQTVAESETSDALSDTAEEVSETTVDATDDKLTLGAALQAQGYRLGSDPSFLPSSETSSSDSTQETSQTQEEAIVPVSTQTPSTTGDTKGYIQTDLDYFTAPSSVTPFFTSSDFLIFEGSFPQGTTKVQVNDYTLQNFNPAEGRFTYRARPDFGNLIVGENIFTARFLDINDSELATELVRVYYAPTQAELDVFEQQEVAKNPTPTVIEDTPKEEPVKEEEEPSKVNQPLSTGLDSNTYYTQLKEPVTMNIGYIEGSAYLSDYALSLSNLLQDEGIKVVLMPLAGEDLANVLSQDTADYDILLTGIHLGIFDYNVFPFFHSGQAKLGQNFSRIRNLELDGLLEQLRDGVYYSSPDKLRELEQSILAFLDPQYVIYPLASPYEYMTWDTSISGMLMPGFLPSSAYLPNILAHASLLHGYDVQPQGKGIGDFLKWIFTTVF